MLKEKNKSPKGLQQQKTVFKNRGERRQEWKWEEGILDQWPEWMGQNEPTPHTFLQRIPNHDLMWERMDFVVVMFKWLWNEAEVRDMVSSTSEKQQVREKSITEINARFKTRKHLEGTLKTLYRQGKPTFIWTDTQSIKHNILKSANLWAYKMVLRVKSTCCESRRL